MNEVSTASRFVRKDRILKQEAAGTVVLLNIDNGKYYALDEVGGRLWDLCDGRQTVSELASIISSEYDAPPETVERDLCELLNQLANENLVVENT